MMRWVIVDELYLDYLRKYDSRIPFSNYGPDKIKPFFGTLFETNNNIVYISQVSHPQPKHTAKKNDFTFKKLLDPKDNRLIAVINLAFMVPIKKEYLTYLSYGQIHNYRNFSNNLEKSKYIDLLSKEIRIINSIDIGKDAKKLYQICLNYPASSVSKRCIDFKLVEKYAIFYSKEY